MSFTIESARTIFPNIQVANSIPATVKLFNQLSSEDQLALLWFAYTEMGVSITPAAISVVNMVFAETILTEIKQMSATEQTQVMCDLVNHANTPICQTYSSFSTNVKLGFWYQLSEWMKEGIITPIPPNYKLSKNASEVLKVIRQMEGGEQLTVLQEIVAKMGYNADNGLPPVKKLVVPSQKSIPRTKMRIKGISNETVQSYMECMNAFDFEASVALFAEDGALQPPFEKPIVGQEKILTYMRNECYGLKLMPEMGVSEPAADGFTQIKVTGQVQTPWFGGSVVIKLVWRFLLNPVGKIYFVGIDLLASPEELLKLVPDQSPKVFHHSDGSELIPSEVESDSQGKDSLAAGYTKDDEGLINSYSVEPAMSKATYPNSKQQLRYVYLGIGAIAFVIALLFIGFAVS